MRSLERPARFTLTFSYVPHILISVTPQCVPRGALDCPPRRALPTRARGTRGRMLHATGVERCPPASVIVRSQLQIIALAVHSDRDVPNQSRYRRSWCAGVRYLATASRTNSSDPSEVATASMNTTTI